MKICTIVTWYNPTSQMWENIQRYLNCLDKIIILDNSNKDNKDLIKSKSKKIFYVPNKKNLGIAKALNIGCEMAIKEGFQWALTMDQDSSFSKEDYKKYISEIKKIRKKDYLAVSFSPNYNKKKEISFEPVKSVITSGNIINLNVWKKIREFDEKLFINEVDTIFCYTLLKNNYRIYQIYEAKMNHNIFDKSLRLKFFGKDYNIRQDDSPIAKYYITRNSFEKNRLFPDITKNRFFLIKLIIKIFFFEHKKFQKFKMIYRGYEDYKKRKFGKID